MISNGAFRARKYITTIALSTMRMTPSTLIGPSVSFIATQAGR